MSGRDKWYWGWEIKQSKKRKVDRSSLLYGGLGVVVVGDREDLKEVTTRYIDRWLKRYQAERK